jgi:hypothetical protein
MRNQTTISHPLVDVPNLLRQVADYLHVDGTTIEDVLPCSPLQESFVALSWQQPGSYMAQFAYDVPIRSTLRACRMPGR